MFTQQIHAVSTGSYSYKLEGRGERDLPLPPGLRSLHLSSFEPRPLPPSIAGLSWFVSPLLFSESLLSPDGLPFPTNIKTNLNPPLYKVQKAVPSIPYLNSFHRPSSVEVLMLFGWMEQMSELSCQYLDRLFGVSFFGWLALSIHSEYQGKQVNGEFSYVWRERSSGSVWLEWSENKCLKEVYRQGDEPQDLKTKTAPPDKETR